MKYRTEEQWNSICENIINGNWFDAGEEAAEYGFYAANMVDFYKYSNNGIDITDLIYLAEIAQEYRS